jgi:3-deoxy-D-manno-octulosonic acid (KDO) 8-phosphate synthase
VTEKIRFTGNNGILPTERDTGFGDRSLVVDVWGHVSQRRPDVPGVFDGRPSVLLPGGAGAAPGGIRGRG